ncbi:MAG: HNH endonuclease [Rhizobiaceae bacterium]|nr:HNH endonuclease [Rhizobiaceae bacterium]
MTKLEERFWAKVAKGEGCWLWTGSVNRQGYGAIRVGKRMRKATHVSILLDTGSWPAQGLIACHKCDNPSCVRPDHLYAGTYKDNARDRDVQGRFVRPPRCSAARQVRGERQHLAKLTPDKVRMIRSGAGTPEHLAAKFGVAKRTIYQVLAGKTWCHVKQA